MMAAHNVGRRLIAHAMLLTFAFSVALAAARLKEGSGSAMGLQQGNSADLASLTGVPGKTASEPERSGRSLQGACSYTPTGWTFIRGYDLPLGSLPLTCPYLGSKSPADIALECSANYLCDSFSIFKLPTDPNEQYCLNRYGSPSFDASSSYMSGYCYGTYVKSSSYYSPYNYSPYYRSPSPSYYYSPSSSSLSPGAIAGIVVGVIGGIGLLVGMGFLIMCQVRQHKRKAARNAAPLSTLTGSDRSVPMKPGPLPTSYTHPNYTSGTQPPVYPPIAAQQSYAQQSYQQQSYPPANASLQYQYPPSAAYAPGYGAPGPQPGQWPAQPAYMQTPGQPAAGPNDGIALVGVNTTTTRSTVTSATGSSLPYSSGMPTSSTRELSSRPSGAMPVAVSGGLVSVASAAPSDAASDITILIRDRKMSNLKIAWNSIKLDENAILGEGGFGTVYKGTWQGTIAVAVKTLKVGKSDLLNLEALRREALIMCDLHHPCIAPVFGLVDDGIHHALIMKFYKRGSLAAAMNHSAYQRMGWAERLKMAQQVASGMLSLHERKPAPVIHGDLKASNLLIDDDGRSVVIADFGLACCLREGQSSQVVESGALTLSISPPEVLLDPSAPRTTAGDVYAFGVLLMEMMIGRPAFRGMSAANLRMAVTSGGRPTIPDSVLPDVSALITHCWAQDAAARPTFAQVLERLNTAVENLPRFGVNAGMTTTLSEVTSTNYY